jgi:two-component system, LuxR family, sensor kinase FixL
MPPQSLLGFLHGTRSASLARAAIAITAIALVDWRFDVDISFGFLYLFPMLMVGAHLTRWQIAAVAALCTFLSEAFDPFPWTVQLGVPRLILTFAAFFGAGLYVFESVRNRRLADQHLAELEKQAELRREAEDQLRFLIESSPASIFTLNVDRKVLLANEAAHRLLDVDPGKLEGQSIARYLPALASVPLSEQVSLFRTTMECRGRRLDGEIFLAQIWFSTYSTVSGPRLAAVVFDASEGLRDREEYSLQQLLAGSKIVVSAVCHEIRNICGAISAVHSKLAREERFSRNEDFAALAGLVEGLGRMAGLELRQTRRLEPESVDVSSVLEQLRIVIDPELRDAGIAIHWDLPERVPAVWAERQALLQAFLNLAKNSERAVEGLPTGELIVRLSSERDGVVVRFIDSGPGVAKPEHLFKPFQQGAAATGLGLYLSRAFVRAFRGDIRYEPQPSGCCFAVVLAPAAAQSEETWTGDDGENPFITAGRPRTLSGEPQPASGH